MASQLETTPSVQSSQAEVWYLKDILFGAPGEEKKEYKIITQNFNGPCSFIAICNILILRGNITILPPERRTVSYEFLSQLVAEYLLTSSPDVDISAALEIMPYTQKGMDLNPLFTSSTSFRPSAHAAGGGLDLFSKARIELVHGWLVDPDSEEGKAIMKVKDYDRAVELIAEVDHLTGGRLVLDEEAFLRGDDGPSGSGSGGGVGSYSDEQKGKIEDAIIVRRFLESTSSQLTYHGLFHLVQSLRPHTLYALFRNSHLSIIYKTIQNPNSNSHSNSDNYADPGGISNTNTNTNNDDSNGEGEAALYSLATDQIFLHEPSIVWERLEDVDGSSSFWVDSDFRRATPAGGDFAGQTAEEAMAAAQIAAGIIDPADHELARQLQAEEEQLAQQEHEQYLQAQQEHAAYEQAQREAMEKKKAAKKKKTHKDCVIM